MITDFVHGQDKINLARIDPDSGHAGDQAFHWLGHSALGTTPGDLSWFSSGGNTIVQGSTDTDSGGRVLDPAQRQCRAEPGGDRFLALSRCSEPVEQLTPSMKAGRPAHALRHDRVRVEGRGHGDHHGDDG